MKGYIANASEVDNVIGRDTVFEGSIESTQSIRIDGSYLGKSLAANYIIVGNTGRVRANIFSDTVVLEGVLLGDITARVRVVLQPGSRLVGNVTTAELITTKGVEFEGTCHVSANGEADIKATVTQYFAPPEQKEKQSER